MNEHGRKGEEVPELCCRGRHIATKAIKTGHLFMIIRCVMPGRWQHWQMQQESHLRYSDTLPVAADIPPMADDVKSMYNHRGQNPPSVEEYESSE